MKQRSKSDSNFYSPGNFEPENLTSYSTNPVLGHFILENQERRGSSPSNVRSPTTQRINEPRANYVSPQTVPGPWNQDNMREVSLAMKQYIGEMEAKQNTMQLQIDSLSAKLSSTHQQLRQSEGELSKERSQNAKDRETLVVKHHEDLKRLECSVLEKEEKLRSTSKVVDKLKNQVDAMHQQKEEIREILHTNETSHKEERIKLDDCIKKQEFKIQSLTAQVEKLKDKDNHSKLIETKLATELQLKAQQMQERADVLGDLKSKIKSLKEELKFAQENVQSKSKDYENLVEVGRVMQFELSKVREKFFEREKEVEDLKEERFALQQELNYRIENEGTLKRAACTGQEMVVTMQQRIGELKEKNTTLSAIMKEQDSKEKELEKKIEELSQLQSNPSYSQSFIENKILEASSKTESKLKKDVASINSKMKRNSEMIRIENDDLKEKLMKLDTENRKLRVEWQSKEQDLRDFYNERLTELSLSYENERRNAQVLNSKLEKSYAIIEDFEDRAQRLSRQSSDSDNHRLNLEVSNTELRVQLEHQIKTLEDLEADRKVTAEKEKQRKIIVSQLRKKNRDLQQANDTFSNEVARLSEEKDRYAYDLDVVRERKEKIEAQSKHLTGNLFEVNQFMQKTREEVEQLRTENERQVDVNQKLATEMELLQAKYENEHERHVENKADNEHFQTQIKEKSEEINNLNRENLTLKRKLQEGVFTMEQLINENEQHKTKVQEKENTLASQKRSFQSKAAECESLSKQIAELTAKQEEMQDGLLTAKQALGISQKDEEDCRKEIRTMKYQVEDMTREHSNLQAQYDGALRDHQNIIEKNKSLMKSVQQLESTVEDVSKERSALSEYAGKLECEMKKGSAVLQKQEKEINDLTKTKENLQECIGEMREKFITIDIQNKRMEKELEQSCQQLEDYHSKFKTIEEQLQTSVETQDKIKLQNSALKMEVEEWKMKYNSSASLAETQEINYQDLLKQCDKLKNDSEHLQKDLSTAKGKIIEMQGIIDGADKKHTWFAQQEMEQNEQIKKLREINEDLKSQLISIKEDTMKERFDYKRLESELKCRSAELEASRIQMESLKESGQHEQEETNAQLLILEKSLKEATSREKESNKACEMLKEHYDDISKRFDESKQRCDELVLESQRATEELAKLEIEINQKSDLEMSINEKNERLQENFVKLVELLRKMKCERDSLSAMLNQSEEENKQIMLRYNKLHGEMLNTSSDLEQRRIRENKAAEDNEQLKSRINILKYAESLRSSENKELLERLTQLEAKLKTKETNQKKQSNNFCSDRQRDLFTDTLNSDTIVNLCKRLHAASSPTARPPSATVQTTAEKYKDELKSFMNELFSKSTESGGISSRHYPNSRPMFRRSAKHKTATRRIFLHGDDDDEGDWKDRQMDKLYEDTRRIQTSLLSDIKQISKGFSDQESLFQR